MIELINKKKNVNLTGSSGNVEFTQTGGGNSGYYIPSADKSGFINFEPTKPYMPEVKPIDLWNRVKIWSAEDGITSNSENPYEFDIGQIPYTEKAGLCLELNNFDLKRYEGKNVGACLIFCDLEKEWSIVFIFTLIAGNLACIFQQRGDNGKTGSCVYLRKGESYINFTAKEESWYFGDFDKEEEVIKIEGDLLTNYLGDFNNLMVIDFASLELAKQSEALGIEIENVVDDFINSVICFYLPSTEYYKAPRYRKKEHICEASGGGLDIEITPEDEGKFLMIQGGAVAKVTIPNVSEEVF